MRLTENNFQFYLALIIALCCSTSANAQEARYSAAQIKADIQFLQSKLVNNHPNLYIYSSKSEVDSFFGSLYQQIPANMTALEAYTYITPVCAKIKDGHTVFFPDDQTINYYNANARYFPFKIYWNGEKMYLELNYSLQDELENGTEIFSINGVPSKEIMDYCTSRLMRDGNNQTYPVWVLNNWFNEYYSYFYGHPTEFTITYSAKDAPIQTQKVKALLKQDIFANRANRYPTRSFSRTSGQKEGDGIVLTIDNESKTATLTIKDFTNKILKSTYKQNFKQTIKTCFTKIKAAEIKNLILDIRNNQGGEIINGQYLLSYLLNEPFKVVEQYYTVGNPLESTTEKRNKISRGAAMGITQPQPDAFKGDLYILINGGSFSNSGIVSAALQYYKRGTFIGEETGGNKNVLCAYEKSIVLPNTRIKVEMPTRQFAIREPDKNTGHGTMPNITIKPSITAMIEGRDEIMECALKLIKR